MTRRKGEGFTSGGFDRDHGSYKLRYPPRMSTMDLLKLLEAEDLFDRWWSSLEVEFVRHRRFTITDPPWQAL